jgi:glycogen operon protein
MGDEVRRTQHGNNNAYCIDDPLTWFDWTLLQKHADIHRFVKLLTARRLLRDVEHEHQRVSLTHLIAQARYAWHGVKVGQPDWADYSHAAALTAELKPEQVLMHFIMNGYWEGLEFDLPPVEGGGENPWRLWLDTALPSPNDIVPWDQAKPIPGYRYRVESRSVVVLYAKLALGSVPR